MTNVGQTATADLVSATTSPAPGGLVRLLGIIAVALAVLSAPASVSSTMICCWEVWRSIGGS